MAGQCGDLVAAEKILIQPKKRWTPFACCLNVLAMNTSPVSNPFTGLKGALAGLMSGGLLGLLLSLLFRRRVAPMLAALESLFAQWQAGTLPLAAAPLPATAEGGLAGSAPRVRPSGGALRSCRRRAGVRRGPVASAVMPRVQRTADFDWRTCRHPVPSRLVPFAAALAPHRGGRCICSLQSGVTAACPNHYEIKTI
jgi:hypothetical protein